MSIKVLESLTNLAPLRSREHRIQVPLVRAFHDPVRNRWERLPEVSLAEGCWFVSWEKDHFVLEKQKSNK